MDLNDFTLRKTNLWIEIFTQAGHTLFSHGLLLEMFHDYGCTPLKGSMATIHGSMKFSPLKRWGCFFLKKDLPRNQTNVDPDNIRAIFRRLPFLLYEVAHVFQQGPFIIRSFFVKCVCFSPTFRDLHSLSANACVASVGFQSLPSAREVPSRFSAWN